MIDGPFCWRLLRDGEPIQKGDQPLADDCETWIELAGWEVGMRYTPHVLKPMRRRVSLKEGDK